MPACVSVPANTALTLVFFNRITSLRGDRRVAENISIYRRESDAYSFSNGAYLFAGAKAHGLAVFVGQNVRWGRTITYHIPPLAPGAYYFQSDEEFASMHGTLLVR